MDLKRSLPTPILCEGHRSNHARHAIEWQVNQIEQNRYNKVLHDNWYLSSIRNAVVSNHAHSSFSLSVLGIKIKQGCGVEPQKPACERQLNVSGHLRFPGAINSKAQSFILDFILEIVPLIHEMNAKRQG